MPLLGAALHSRSDLDLLTHELVFWLGDLNYRLRDDFSAEEVIARVERGRLEDLRALDQLNCERSHGRVLQGFEEGLLGFAPTYKYQPDTDRSRHSCPTMINYTKYIK